MSELPTGWVETTVGDTGEYVNGFAFKPTHWSPHGRPIIRIQNLTDPTAPLNRTALDVPSHYIVKSGDILVSWSATLDAFRWAGEEALLNQHIFVVRPKRSLVDDAYLFYMLRSVMAEIVSGEHLHGSTMKHVNRGPFLAHRVALPPIAEQQRIVARLDDLLGCIRRTREELAAIPALLERYRQSVLAAAFRGELTADWRAKHLEAGSASKLLDSVRMARRQLWERTELARFGARGKTPTDERWKEKYEPPPALQAQTLSALPERWCWAGLSELAELQLGQRRAPEFANEASYPYVRAGNITWRGLDLSDVKRMGFLHPEPLFLKPGDVLLNEASGSPTEVGKPALWRGEISSCCFQATVLRVRAASTLVDGEWLCLALLRDARMGQFAAMAPGVGMVHLSAERMRSWPIPIAPLEEQKVIVSLVRRSLEWIDRLDDELRALASRNEEMERSILTRAFRGELVPQDPADEPASVLLERIRAERAAAPAKKPARKPRKTDS